MGVSATILFCGSFFLTFKRRFQDIDFFFFSLIEVGHGAGLEFFGVGVSNHNATMKNITLRVRLHSAQPASRKIFIHSLDAL